MVTIHKDSLWTGPVSHTSSTNTQYHDAESTQIPLVALFALLHPHHVCAAVQSPDFGPDQHPSLHHYPDPYAILLAIKLIILVHKVCTYRADARVPCHTVLHKDRHLGNSIDSA